MLAFGRLQPQMQTAWSSNPANELQANAVSCMIKQVLQVIPQMRILAFLMPIMQTDAPNSAFRTVARQI